ncbi:MAG: dynamin family protein [Chitinophagales bacterium]|nr:dynamin family protein [Bacteroidota bacterium]MCB9042154.1 dynamin family protein [Chitinophagales bacterium]
MIDENLGQVQIVVAEAYTQLSTLLNKIGNDELRQTVDAIRFKLNEPFLFVIVGEVKAGKSSFINALLATGKEICKVAPDPCTDTVQQIIYGDTQQEYVINPNLKKISLPVEILQQISIVDTPGTNTISEYHQQITEEFVPQSDLIVFVFEAKNPYRQSAWNFFDFISKEWHKKVIFILQQADLMSPEDLAVNIKGVEKMATDKGIVQPIIFAVSAKMELEGYHKVSGFLPLRQYIADNITGGNARKLKLESNISTARRIVENIRAATQTRQQQLQADIDFREEIERAMNEQENKSYQRIDGMVKELLTDYDRITANIRYEFSSGLNFFSLAGRSLKSVFSSDEKNVKEWLASLTRKLEVELRSNFQEKLENRMNDISDSIKQMVKIVDLKMNASKTILATDNEIFGDIAEKRQEAIKAIQQNYYEFVNNTENFVDRKLFPVTSSYAPNIAAGGGLAVIGAILAGTSQAMVFDITGGIIAAVGLSIAGATLFFQRGKVLKSFDQEIANGREQLNFALNEKVKEYSHKIKNRLDQNFDPLDIHISQETAALQQLNDRIGTVEGQLNKAATELAQVKV